ncbi:F-box protein At2g26160 [Ziziphus jujuba]|uniref:F-box protein At2g26160 n=1 Tax=Ziziphus jujuba TaxID=326968 RepID=A0A6P3Z3I5_ZIZJJ|nr:F-box protein At2g26160 [Ziziphus jujuba]
MERRVGWSELPTEILSMIGNCLDSPLDVVRLRSVCNSWRSSFPLFNQSAPPSPLKFPSPFADVDAFLSESTIYRLEPVDDEIDNPNNPNPSASSSSTRRRPSRSLPSKACLVRVEDTKASKFQLFSCGLDDGAPVPNDLSLLKFRMVKLGKSNGLSLNNGSFCLPGVNKVIRNPNSSSLYSEDCSIFVIFDGGKLGFAMNGDRKLTPIGDRDTDYNDIVVYRGKPCVVDNLGTVSWIDDMSLELTPLLLPHQLDLDSGGWKHLVESGGELYVVHRYCEKIRMRYSSVDEIDTRGRRFFRRNGKLFDGGNTVGFRVYKLDLKWHRWVEVMTLGDKAFVLYDDICFSVSASEFDGCKGNCIYFKDEINCNLFSFYRTGCNFFNLEDRSIHPYRWSKPLCFSSLHLNTRIWLLDCFNYLAT